MTTAHFRDVQLIAISSHSFSLCMFLFSHLTLLLPYQSSGTCIIPFDVAIWFQPGVLFAIFSSKWPIAHVEVRCGLSDNCAFSGRSASLLERWSHWGASTRKTSFFHYRSLLGCCDKSWNKVACLPLSSTNWITAWAKPWLFPLWGVQPSTYSASPLIVPVLAWSKEQCFLSCSKVTRSSFLLCLHGSCDKSWHKFAQLPSSSDNWITVRANPWLFVLWGVQPTSYGALL